MLSPQDKKMRKVTIPSNVVTGKPFSPEEMVALLDCGITAAEYRALIERMACYTPQGFADRGPECRPDGVWTAAPVCPHTGKPLQEENAPDEVEKKLKRLMWVSFQRHYHLTVCGNRWPERFDLPEVEPQQFPRDLETEANT
jgi:hypothetical protein